jgi:hypothetical protein
VTPPKTRSCEKFLRKTQEKKEILRNPVRNGFLDPKNKFLKTGICNPSLNGVTLRILILSDLVPH